MAVLSHFNLVCSVVGARQKQGGGHTIEQVYGTAFYLGNDIFLTAGHSLQSACLHDIFGIGFSIPGTGQLIVSKIGKFDVVEQFDIGLALVEAHIPSVRALKWRSGECPLLTDVKTVGYALAYDPATKVLTIRAFKGYIVSVVHGDWFKAKPPVYELSFAAPRGLSGAPLLVDVQGGAEVVGIILGNKSTEMEVFREKEIISAEKEETFVRVEAFQFGVATVAEALLAVRSEVVGKSLNDYLKQSGLISDVAERG